MTIVSELKKKASAVTSNINVMDALVGYMLFLLHAPTDYAGAAREAAYDLEESDCEEFALALKKLVFA